MTTKLITRDGPYVTYDSVTGTVVTNVQVYSKSVSGTNTAGFRSIKKRNLPMNSYQMIGFRRVFAKRYTRIVELTPQGLTSSTKYQLSDVALIPLEPSTYVKNIAISAANSLCLARIKSSDINLAQTFGERMQTVRMIGNTARRLAGCYSHLRRGRLGSALASLGSDTIEFEQRRPGAARRYHTTYPKNPQQAASSAWLEMQYGWRPLLSDIYGGAKTLAEYHVDRESDLYLAPATVSSKAGSQETGDLGSGFSSEATVGVKQRITYVVTNPLLRYSSMLGLTNPALLAWELTPFSFVVDWFLPIGSYLSSIDAAYGCQFLKGFRSVRTQSVSVGYSSTYSYSPGAQIYESYLRLGPSEHFTLRRSPLYTFPTVDFPKFKSPLGVNHAITAVSLLIQVFKHK